MDASRNASSQAAPLARGTSASRASVARLAAALLVLLLATQAARALGDPVVRPGKWNPKKAPPGWVVVETDHYQVQSQCGKDKAVALAAHLESMLDLYRSFLPTHRKLDGFVLKLFKDRQAFVDYGGNGGAVAYYSQGAGELVGYDTGVVLGKRDIPAQLGLTPEAEKDLTPEERTRIAELFEEITDAYTMDTARVLSHEGWHQYFHFYTTSIVTMPAWIDEGIGDYFFMASRDEQHGDASGYRLGDINQGRMRTLQRAFTDGAAVSFQKLLGFAQEEYYANPGVYYAQGWSMVQFLMHNETPAFRELIPKFIKDFKDSKNFQKSTTKVFKGLDMDALDKAWISWALEQKPVDPLRTLARAFGGRLKPEDFTGEKRWLTVYTWHVKHPAEPAVDTPAGETPEGAPGNPPRPPGAVPARCAPGI